MRTATLLAAGFAVALCASVRLARASERANVELGPDVGVVARPARGDFGASYGPAFAYGAHFQLPLAPVARITAYYAHTAQSIELERGALGTTAVATPNGRLTSYVLGARIQPTWNVSTRLHLWLDFAIAWGIMTAPIVHVAAPVPYEMGTYDAAFVELPFGAGGEFDVLPGWAGVTLDLTAGPVLGGFDPQNRLQTLDAAGRVVDSPTLPSFGSTWSAMLGVVLHR